jgi:hypothetical protein
MRRPATPEAEAWPRLDTHPRAARLRRPALHLHRSGRNGVGGTAAAVGGTAAAGAVWEDAGLRHRLVTSRPALVFYCTVLVVAVAVGLVFGYLLEH